MAVCDFCKKEMTDAKTVSCVMIPIKMRKGGQMNPLTFSPEINQSDGCRDCGIMAGGFHHPGCDVEACPKCGGQLISCRCQK